MSAAPSNRKTPSSSVTADATAVPAASSRVTVTPSTRGSPAPITPLRSRSAHTTSSTSTSATVDSSVDCSTVSEPGAALRTSSTVGARPELRSTGSAARGASSAVVSPGAMSPAGGAIDAQQAAPVTSTDQLPSSPTTVDTGAPKASSDVPHDPSGPGSAAQTTVTTVPAAPRPVVAPVVPGAGTERSGPSAMPTAVDSVVPAGSSSDGRSPVSTGAGGSIVTPVVASVVTGAPGDAGGATATSSAPSSSAATAITTTPDTDPGGASACTVGTALAIAPETATSAAARRPMRRGAAGWSSSRTTSWPSDAEDVTAVRPRAGTPARAPSSSRAGWIVQ